MEGFFDDGAPRARSLRCRSLRSLAALTFIVLTVLLSSPVSAQAADLFTAVNQTPLPSLPAVGLTLRSRVVTMDLGQVERAQAAVTEPLDPPTYTRDAPRTAKQRTVPAPGTTLTLNLFDDTVITGIVEQTAPTFSGGYSVSGRIAAEPLGTLTLVVNGETVAGTVRLPGETYRIRSMGDGLYAVSEVEEPPLNCGVEEPHSEADHPH